MKKREVIQGETIIVYTYEQGGIMHVSPWWGTREDFEKAKETGWLVTKPDADNPAGVPLAMVALCRVEELHDFKMDDVEVVRVDGRKICDQCGKSYRDHPDDPACPWPTFVLLCDGTHAKT